MGKSSRSKKKVAGPKTRGKRAGKAKDLPAKGRGAMGGAINLASPQLTTQTFGGVVLKRGEALNLGL